MENGPTTHMPIYLSGGWETGNLFGVGMAYSYIRTIKNSKNSKGK